MKKFLFLIGLFFTSMPRVTHAEGYDVNFSTKNNSLDGYELIVSSGDYGIVHPFPVSYIFSGMAGKEILRIDPDGDIFLRGKWIGWDGRFCSRQKK